MKTIHYLDVGTDGIIIGSGSTTAPSIEGMPGAKGKYVEIEFPVDKPDEWFWKHGALMKRAKKPSHPATYDPVSGACVTDIERVWTEVRIKRDNLFASTEWVRSRAQDQGVPVNPDWLIYWQALRDITEQSNPMNIEWPVSPNL